METYKAVDVLNDVRDELFNPLTAVGLALKTLLRRWDDLNDQERLEIAGTALESVERLDEVAQRITEMLSKLTPIEEWAGEIRLPELEQPA